MHRKQDNCTIFRENRHQDKAIFPNTNSMKYIYTIKRRTPAMFFKKYTNYLLFFLAYIGALIIEKPA